MLIKFGPFVDANTNTLPFINLAAEKNFDNMLLQDGDIIIADTAEDETVGKATEIINTGNRKIVSGLHTIACRPKIKMIPTYLGFYFNSEAYHKQLYSLMQGIKVLSISKSNIETTIIKYPCIGEQAKICSMLYLIEKRIAKQQQLIEHLKKYKRGVEASFFYIKQHACENENQGLVRVPLGNIVTINPKTPALPEHFIYIDLESVDSGRLQTLKHINRENAPSRAQRVLADGDVLFQMVRPYQKNNYYFRDIFDSPVVASTGYAQIRCQKCDPVFVFEQISSDYFSQEAMLRSTGTGYPAINSDGLAEIPFFLPPLSEQKRIGKFLSLLSSKTESEKRKLDIFYSLKAALLQQLFI